MLILDFGSLEEKGDWINDLITGYEKIETDGGRLQKLKTQLLDERKKEITKKIKLY